MPTTLFFLSICFDGQVESFGLGMPQQIEDQATYKNPHRYPKGIPYVVVNGELVVENGGHTSALAGKVIQRLRYSK